MSANKINERVTRYSFGGVNCYLIDDGRIRVMIGCVPEMYGDAYAAAAGAADAVILLTSKPEYAAGLGVLIKNRPDIAVYASPAGLRNIKEIVGCDINEHIVKDGAACSLAPDISFYAVPDVHWVDTVSAVYSGILFSGELFSGAGTEQGLEGFYRSRLDVNRGFVRTALEKLSGIDIETVCPARGEAIYADGLDSLFESFRQWSGEKVRKTKKAVIIYASFSGFTRLLAQKAAERLAEKYESRLINAYETAEDEIISEINDADILLIGTHTVNRNAPKEIWRAVAGIDLVNKRGMEYLVFGSFGWAGDGIKLINTTLASMGLRRAAKPVEVLFRPSAEDIADLYKALDKFSE